MSKKNLWHPQNYGYFAGRIEMPGGPDCGPWAMRWTLLL